MRKDIALQNVTFWICSPKSGIHDGVILPPGRRFTRDFLRGEVLGHFDDRMAETRNEKRSNGTFLQIENARPQLAQAKSDSLDFQRLIHPPYSPDTTPCHFWLFRSLQIKLEAMPCAIPSAVLRAAK
jgi:hypothetical protein